MQKCMPRRSKSFGETSDPLAFPSTAMSFISRQSSVSGLGASSATSTTGSVCSRAGGSTWSRPARRSFAQDRARAERRKALCCSPRICEMVEETPPPVRRALASAAQLHTVGESSLIQAVLTKRPLIFQSLRPGRGYEYFRYYLGCCMPEEGCMTPPAYCRGRWHNPRATARADRSTLSSPDVAWNGHWHAIPRGKSGL
jgi:hypothetical protein